jgi:hypothetical protein
MSDLLNQASLVVIPSGYKEDTVYSVVPSDGSGDLSFTRASNGTRVNSAGLVEVVPWNLVQNSEQYSAGTWLLAFLSISIDSAVAPNGTTTADLLYPSSSQAYCYVSTTSFSVVAGQTYTQSVYLKRSGFRWGIVDNMAGGPGAWFDLLNGVVGNVTSGCTASIESVGNGWYKCSVSSVAQSSTNYADFRMSDANGGSAVTANGTDGLLAWGFQLNIGATAKPYFPTTDRLNVPRLTYQNGGGGCPSLLLEKQSTNYCLWSEDFTTTWSLTNTIATANQTTSPDGTQNADKLSDTNGTGQHRYFQNVLTGLTNQTLSFSIYAKQGTHRYISWGVTDDTDYRGQVVVDLQTGTITDQFTASATLSNLSVVSQGNGWYKISGTIAVSANWAGGNAYAFGLMLNSSSWSTAGYTGNNTNFYIWGAQVEQSSYPTSYIPTTSSSATRVADACFKTGISSLIGQSQGTMFVDVDLTHPNASGTNEYLMQLYQAAGERIILYRDNSNGLSYYYLKGTTIFFYNSSVTTNGRHKLAFAYKSGDSAFYIDGVQIDTDTSTFSAFSSLSELHLGANYNPTQAEIGDYEYNEAIVFPTRLTNAELASLTTI